MQTGDDWVRKNGFYHKSNGLTPSNASLWFAIYMPLHHKCILIALEYECFCRVKTRKTDAPEHKKAITHCHIGRSKCRSYFVYLRQREEWLPNTRNMKRLVVKKIRNQNPFNFKLILVGFIRTRSMKVKPLKKNINVKIGRKTKKRLPLHRLFSEWRFLRSFKMRREGLNACPMV